MNNNYSRLFQRKLAINFNIRKSKKKNKGELYMKIGSFNCVSDESAINVKLTDYDKTHYVFKSKHHQASTPLNFLQYPFFDLEFISFLRQLY